MPRIKKTRLMSAREIIVWGIHNEKTNAEVVQLVLKKHSNSTTTAATVNYIRNQLRRKIKSLKSDRVTRRGR